MIITKYNVYCLKVNEYNQQIVYRPLLFFTAASWDAYEYEKLSQNSMIVFIFVKIFEM